MRRLVLTALLVVLASVVPTAQAAGSAQPWEAAADVQDALGKAAAALVLVGPEGANTSITAAQTAYDADLRPLLRTSAADEEQAVEAGIVAARAAIAADSPQALEVARAQVETALQAAAARLAVNAAADGDATAARSWLLVRAFRPPTRFTRPGADATLALRALATGATTPAAAATAVRTDLLDTYQARLRAELDSLAGKDLADLPVRRAQAGALVAGWWAILAPALAEQRGPAEADRATAAVAALAAAAAEPDAAAVAPALAPVRTLVDGFRAAPLPPEEQARRAGQVRRFVALVPVEYGRGVDDGRVTLDFEIQEAITFRDGAASAYGDLQPLVAAQQPAGAQQIADAIAKLGTTLADATGGGPVAEPDDVTAQSEQILALTEKLFPEAWQDDGGAADFDVIAATLDRMEAAASAGQASRAEQARLEAYAIFEFGPEQRLRGLAPTVFQRVEGLFWYGVDDHPGLVQLLARRSSGEELHATRVALDDALEESQRRIGEGAGSTSAVVANTAVIVFREGLEAVLILAVLTAGMVGAERRLRRPMFTGAWVALVASGITWVIAQTVLGSLNRHGEQLEAIVGLVAIAVLLLILNWFFHRVYWTGHLAGLHQKKRAVMKGKAGGFLAAPAVGLVLLGFTSVYREGFETVLFLQALVLEAGTAPVVLGVLVGLVATAAVGVVTFALQQKLPYKKMLIGTGLLVAWVLVVMVGTTVQALQSVGWMPVSPIEGLQFPYWAGLWFGLYPTWQGLLLQGVALAFVIGSYFGAELLRSRKRAQVRSGGARSAEAQPGETAPVAAVTEPGPAP